MRYIAIVLSLLLTGCAALKPIQSPAPVKEATPVKEIAKPYKIIEAPIINVSPLAKELKALPPLDGKVITIAVYSFLDRTGQRKSAENYASFSAAVTQGAESWLIESLQLAGNGTWFKVLERNGLDDLIKERQMYRQAREEFENDKGSGLSPMLFAGIIAQGGIVGYDSNIETGGLGASVLGIGVSNQYRKDVITISLRIVSTNTGEVLLSVATTKTVYSTMTNGSALAFINNGTRYGEAELGKANNEPVTIAVRAAIDAAVIEIINQGQVKGFWKFKQP